MALLCSPAGSGESNIRRYIIENDYLEAIIALPENMFYNTGIATYIWILTNRKPTRKQGKVQLIDASSWSVPLRKNLGKKNCEFSEAQIKTISDLLIDFCETKQSKIFPNKALGYSKITVERPLRLKVDLSRRSLSQFAKRCTQEKESVLAELVSNIAQENNLSSCNNYNTFIALVKKEMPLTKKRQDLLRKELTTIDENSEPVIKKLHQPRAKKPNPLQGLYEKKIDGKTAIIEYEPDSNLRDTEQIPLIEPGGIEAFFKREVLPYTPDAWIDSSKTTIGYEISFTKHFYEPIQMRSLQEIETDILALEQETEGLLSEILGKASL